jgi:hypothetical protein
MKNNYIRKDGTESGLPLDLKAGASLRKTLDISNAFAFLALHPLR